MNLSRPDQSIVVSTPSFSFGTRRCMCMCAEFHRSSLCYWQLVETTKSRVFAMPDFRRTTKVFICKTILGKEWCATILFQVARSGQSPRFLDFRYPWCVRYCSLSLIKGRSELHLKCVPSKTKRSGSEGNRESGYTWNFVTSNCPGLKVFQASSNRLTNCLLPYLLIWSLPRNRWWRMERMSPFHKFCYWFMQQLGSVVPRWRWWKKPNVGSVLYAKMVYRSCLWHYQKVCQHYI